MYAGRILLASYQHIKRQINRFRREKTPLIVEVYKIGEFKPRFTKSDYSRVLSLAVVLENDIAEYKRLGFTAEEIQENKELRLKELKKRHFRGRVIDKKNIK